MGKAQRKDVALAGAASAAEPQGFVPDPSMHEVELTQPRLDVSAAGPGSDQELWLLQLPLEFPPDARVEWKVEDDSLDGFRGRCQVNGVEYLLVPDQQALSADIYATPADAHGKLTPVVRRLTVVRSTAAPQLCFGQSEAEAKLAGLVAPGAPRGNAVLADRATAKRKRAEGAAPAAAVTAGNLAAGADQQQQQQQQLQQQQGRGQQEDGGSKKRKKDKGEKKEKKRKSGAGGETAGAAAAAAEAAPAAAAEAAGDERTEQKPEKKDTKRKSEAAAGGGPATAAAAAGAAEPTAAAGGKSTEKQSTKKEKSAKKEKKEKKEKKKEKS